jgi:hypothetical protein
MVDRERKTDLVNFQCMWYLVFMGVLLTIDCRAEIVDSRRSKACVPARVIE